MCAFCSPTLNEHDYPATPSATYVSYRKNHAASKKIPSIPPTSLSTDFLVKCILGAYALHGLSTLGCRQRLGAVDDKRHISLNKDEGPDKNPRSGSLIEDKVAIHCLETVEHHHFTVLAWRPKKDGVETLPFLDREGNILPISGHNLEALQVSVGKIATHPFSSDSSKDTLQQENAELKEILRGEAINDFHLTVTLLPENHLRAVVGFVKSIIQEKDLKDTKERHEQMETELEILSESTDEYVTKLRSHFPYADYYQLKLAMVECKLDVSELACNFEDFVER
ncbi:uncharacterized protein FRV6_16326 [Fusarium oxysporum]|uniref:Uncharacterized protein n=1 Tax=Fusarium oxysporum TaxID=5507 RepID=A0A2H3TUB0_FUSOX|nr:uncharacterized protein FRV6_16326 [Fusarium oxysporum]